MEVLVVAADSLKALSLEATLDVGGHRVVGLADSAAAAYFLAVAITRRDFFYLFVEMKEAVVTWMQRVL